MKWELDWDQRHRFKRFVCEVVTSMTSNFGLCRTKWKNKAMNASSYRLTSVQILSVQTQQTSWWWGGIPGLSVGSASSPVPCPYNRVLVLNHSWVTFLLNRMEYYLCQTNWHVRVFVASWFRAREPLYSIPLLEHLSPSSLQRVHLQVFLPIQLPSAGTRVNGRTMATFFFADILSSTFFVNLFVSKSTIKKRQINIFGMREKATYFPPSRRTSGWSRLNEEMWLSDDVRCHIYLAAYYPAQLSCGSGWYGTASYKAGL